MTTALAQDRGPALATLLTGLACIALCAVVALWQRSRPAAVAPPVAIEHVQPWMLETAYGIGPITAPRLLKAYRELGISVLPTRAQEQLRGLIADIPVREKPHSSAQ